MVIGILFAIPARAISHPSSPPPDTYENAMNRGDFKSAQKALSQHLKRNPDQAQLWFNQGELLLAQGKFSQAIHPYQVSIEKDPSLAPFAQVFIAHCQWQIGKYPEALRALDLAIAKNKTPSFTPIILEEQKTARDALYRNVLPQYQNHQYALAYARLKFLEGSDAGTQLNLLLGLLQFELGQKTAAQSTLKRSAKGPPEDPYAEEARKTLEKMKALESVHPGGRNPRSNTGLVEIAGGNNSNVYSSAIASNGLAPPGYSRRIATAILGGKFPIGTTPTLWTDLETIARWEEEFGLAMDRSQIIHARLNFSLVKDPTLIAELAPQVRFEALDFRSQYWRPGLRLRLGREHSTSAFYGALEIQKNIAASPDTQYQEGYALSATLNYRKSWTRIQAEGFLGYLREANHDFSISNVILPLAYQAFSTGFWGKWQASERMSIYLQPSWTWKYYFTRAQPDNLQRIDLTIAALARLDWRLSKGWSVFNQWNLEINQSTLGSDRIVDKNYTQIKSVLGLTWDF